MNCAAHSLPSIPKKNPSVSAGAFPEFGRTNTKARTIGHTPERFKLKSGVSPRIRTQLIRVYRREAVNPSAFAWYAKDTLKGATAPTPRGCDSQRERGRVAREFHGKIVFPAPVL